MTNATKTLVFVFVCLLGLTGLVEWMAAPESSEAFQRNILVVDTSRVRQLTVTRPSDEIVLTRSGDTWTVRGSEDSSSYPADAGAVQRALETLTTAEVYSVASRREEEHARYGVDSTGTRVSLLDEDGRPLQAVVLGRTQYGGGTASGQPFAPGGVSMRTYVRRAGEPEVYVVEGALTSSFSRDVEGWRDRSVWKLDRDAVTQVDLFFPADSSYSLRRVTEDSTTFWLSGSDTLDTSRVSRLLNRLASVRATGFVDTTSVDAFGDPLYRVQVHLDDGSTRTLHVKEGSDDYM